MFSAGGPPFAVVEPPPLLAVDNLRVCLRDAEATPILHGLSFELRRGETLAVVGESGCGKSVASLAVMGLLPPSLRVAGGRIVLDGQDLTTLSPRALRSVRGRRIGMVFQEPMTTLNPAIPVGAQVAEALREHGDMSRRAAWDRAVELLDQVRIPEPARAAHAYPHSLSGGQRQRVVIAAAVACNPDLIIADEPTTALDVTVQAQVLDLLLALGRERGSALLLITHNLGVVARVADRVMVLYSGRKVEENTVFPLFAAPNHPYTRGLMAATPNPPRQAAPLPVLVPAAGAAPVPALAPVPTVVPAAAPILREIPGLVPSVFEQPPGCPFGPRCALHQPPCDLTVPALAPVPGGGLAACILAADSPQRAA